jgi:uncharacterized damage-inducible protein DinB
MTLPIEAVRVLFEREIDAFTREIEAYPTDDAVFATPPGISNSAGSLALHVAGNLQLFVGNRIGGSGYVRDRDAEFARRGVTRKELVAELARAKEAVRAALADRDPASVPSVFPDKVAGKTMTTEVFVLHLVAHLAYHLGQVDYHRRITTGDAKTVDTVSVPALPGIS